MGTFCADQFDFYLGSRWVWGSVGVSWAALVVFTAAGVAAMTLSNPPSPKPTGALAGQWAGWQPCTACDLHTSCVPARGQGERLRSCSLPWSAIPRGTLSPLCNAWLRAHLHAVPEEEQKQEVKRGVFAGLLQRESLALQAAGSGLSLALHAAGSGLSLASSGRLAAKPKPAGASSVPNDANGATPALVPAGSGAGEGELELERALSRLEVVGQAAGERRERMVVPFTPITLVCRNIRCCLPLASMPDPASPQR